MIHQHTFKKVFLALLAICSFAGARAQLVVDTAMDPNQMVQNLVGEGVQIFNVQVTAADGSFGYYYANGTEIGTNQGLILTTGQATNAIGPNNSSGLPQLGPGGVCLNCDLFDNDFQGSDLLNEAQDRTTFDATMIEFDIVPQGDSLRFEYTFASEEYLEWVGSPFNDVFGFYITGPGIGTDVNIALIPGTSEAVAINNVNNVSNSIYFDNNIAPPGQFIQYDGLTVNLAAAVGGLTPCETYHLKLIIADGSDRLYDSGVFVRRIESNPVIVLTTTAGGIDYMIEGCNSGTITFCREEVDSNPLEFNYWIGGTATNGVDYTLLGSGTPFDPITLTIPANESCIEVPIEAFADESTEGAEYLTIYLGNPLCTGAEVLDSTNFYIEDFLEVQVTASPENICAGQCTQLTGNAVNEGLATFEWSPTTALDDPNSLTPEACPVETTTYTLTSSVSECTSSASVTVGVSYITIELEGSEVNCEGGSTGTIDLTVLDAVNPLTITWSGPDGFVSNDEDLTGVPAGEYCVEVVDAGGCVATGCITLVETNELTIASETLSDYSCYPISCNGATDGSIDIEVTGGVDPYTYEWSGPDGFTADTQDISNLGAGTYTVTITDGAGCILIDSYLLEQPEPVTIQVVGSIDLLCTGVETGSAEVSASGGCSPYFYSWSHDPNLTAPVATNLGSGLYTVSVEDVNGCQSQGSVEITINDPIDPLEVAVDEVSLYPGGYGVSCPGASDGFVNITASNGTLPYTFEWVLAGTGTVSTDEDLVNAACGTYTLTVTDGNGCEESVIVEVTCVPEIEIEFDVVPNPCGQEDAGIGAIDILTTTGGNGGAYTYEWSGPDGFTASTEDIINVNSGPYELTVTDNQGCQQVFNLSVGTNDAFSVDAVETDISCGGACDGSILLTITPPTAVTYTWTGPDGSLPSVEDQTNLCPGDYSVYVEDVNGCFEELFFTITEPDPIIVVVVETVDPTCNGQNNGSINIQASGGTGVLSFNWAAEPELFFAGSTSEDISNLFEGCYVLTVTDEAGCSETIEVCIDAPEVMDIFVEVSEFNGGFNISCAGAQDGSISVTVSGGTPDCDAFAPYCYLYDWSGCGDIGDNDPNSNLLTALPGGTYCVNVFDANGCLATTTITMLEPEPIDETATVTNVTCFGENDGTITPNLAGGSGTYIDFDWTEGNIGTNAPDAATLTNLAPGCYTLVVTDNNQCTNEFTWCITEPEELTLEITSVTQVTCYNANDGAATFTAAGGTGILSFNTTGPGGSYPGDAISGLAPGDYTVTVTDENGCTATDTFTIDEVPEFIADIEALIANEGQIFTLACFGSEDASLEVNITGGIPELSIEWTDGDGNVLGTDTIISNLGAGNYCVEVTDANGCVASDCFEITQPEEPLVVSAAVLVYPGDYNVSCFGACDGEIDLTVTGGVEPYTFQWELGDGSLDTDEDQTGLCEGLYEVLVTDANGCDTLIQFNLTSPAPIVIEATISDYNGFNISCNGACDGSISLNILGGDPEYTIDWQDPLLPDQEEVTGLCPGTYAVTVTDSRGCTQEASYTISEPEVLSVSISSSYDCNTGNITLCASADGGSGNNSISWDGGEITDCIEVTADGEYCVTITDSNGCTAEACIDVLVPTQLELEISSTNPVCGQDNGTIDITITGEGPFDIVWTGPGVDPDSEDQAGLGAGTYSVTITDANNCTVNGSVTLSDSNPIQVSETITDLNCFDDGSGAIEIEFSNATEPIEINWTGPDGPVDGGTLIDELSAGDYTLEWTDANGCTGTEEYTVAQPDTLTINAELSLYDLGFNISEFDGSDGAIDTDVQGGTPQYTYDWSVDALDGEADVAGLPAGTYILTVTDANGCSVDTTIVLTQPLDLALPTGLTPNGDNFNDFYVIQGIEGFPDNEFRVFNRWGNLVYEKDGYQNEWRGQSNNGDDLADGTYFVVFIAGNREFNTYVDLRR